MFSTSHLEFLCIMLLACFSAPIATMGTTGDDLPPIDVMFDHVTLATPTAITLLSDSSSEDPIPPTCATSTVCQSEPNPLYESVLNKEVLTADFVQANSNVLNCCNNVLKRTALHIAVILGATNSVDALLHHPDIDVNTVDVFGWSPLRSCIFSENQESHRILKSFLDSDAIDVNDHVAGLNICPLQLSLISKDTAKIRLVLQHPQLDLNSVDSYESFVSVLRDPVTDEGTDIVRDFFVLPHQGINLKGIRSDGSTLLHSLISWKMSMSLELLLASCHPDRLDQLDFVSGDPETGETPLQMALRIGGRVLELMLAYTPALGFQTPNAKTGESSIITSIQLERHDATVFMLSHPTINIVNDIITESGESVFELLACGSKFFSSEVELLLRTEYQPSWDLGAGWRNSQPSPIGCFCRHIQGDATRNTLVIDLMQVFVETFGDSISEEQLELALNTCGYNLYRYDTDPDLLQETLTDIERKIDHEDTELQWPLEILGNIGQDVGGLVASFYGHLVSAALRTAESDPENRYVFWEEPTPQGSTTIFMPASAGFLKGVRMPRFSKVPAWNCASSSSYPSASRSRSRGPTRSPSPQPIIQPSPQSHVLSRCPTRSPSYQSGGHSSQRSQVCNIQENLPLPVSLLRLKSFANLSIDHHVYVDEFTA